jgi:hypothetical protein
MEAASEKSLVKLEAFRALRAKLAGEAAAATPPRETAATGVRGLDEAAGGLLRGALTEFSGSSGHGSLFLSALLEMCGREHWHMALVDAADQFEPADWDAAAMRRMLWVRCREAKKALRAADLLLRDGNLPLIVLDLAGVPPAQLRKIPVNTWHRFQRVVEESRVTMVVLSLRPMVEGARVRIEAEGRLGLDAMRLRRNELSSRMAVQVRQRTAGWEAARRMA